jgi:hypothetical protein
MTQIATIGDPRASDPVHHAIVVTPNDRADLPAATTTVYIGGAGDLRVTMLGGEGLIFRGLPVGWHAIRVTRIFSTNTTATNIIAAWR